MQWDDEHIPREAGLALFDAFASKEKTLHANAGKHEELPGSRPTARSGSSPGTSAGRHITSLTRGYRPPAQRR